MRRLFFLCAFSAIFALNALAQEPDTVRHEVLFQTSMGDIRVVLYNETPRHQIGRASCRERVYACV